MFSEEGITLGAPGLFPIELFYAWIAKLMLVYQEKEQENDDLLPKQSKSIKPTNEKTK